MLPKRGNCSAGVHQRFLPESGRTVNCQLGLGLFLDAGQTHVPVDWRLFLPPRFTRDEAVRDRAKIPATTRAQPLWDHALRLVQEMASWSDGRTAPVVADLTALCDVAPLAQRLQGGGHAFVLAIPGQTTLAGPELPPGERESARGLLLRRGVRHPASTSAGHLVRHTRTRAAPGRRAQPRGGPADGRVGRGQRASGPDLADEHHRPPPGRPAGAGAFAPGAQASIDRMGEDFGLLDFEGRSFPGWHRHMTLVSAAYACSTLEGMTQA